MQLFSTERAQLDGHYLGQVSSTDENQYLSCSTQQYVQLNNNVKRSSLLTLLVTRQLSVNRNTGKNRCSSSIITTRQPALFTFTRMRASSE